MPTGRRCPSPSGPTRFSSDDEPLDVLHADGRPTGRSKRRGRVHRDGDWHRAVHIWLYNDRRELLLQKRSRQKDTHPGMWDVSCAGHLTAGDDSRTAAVRELHEELGLEAGPEELRFLWSRRASRMGMRLAARSPKPVLTP